MTAAVVNLADYRARRAAPSLARGDIVRHRAFDWAGVVRRVQPDGMAEIAVGKATHICRADALRVVDRLADARPCDSESDGAA